MVSPPHHGCLLARPVVLPAGGARFVVTTAPHDPDPSVVPTGDRDPATVFPDGVDVEAREDRVRLGTQVAPACAGRERLWLQVTRDGFESPAAQVVFPRWAPQPARDFEVEVDLGRGLASGGDRCRFVYDGAVSPVETVPAAADAASPREQFGRTD